MREGGDYLALRMRDFFSYARRDGIYLTCFLDCAQQRYLQQHKSGFSVCFYGGFQEAERKKALISDVELPDEKMDQYENFKINLLFVAFQGNIQHKDILGAVLALGIKRELIGDILVRKEGAYLFCDSKITPFLLQNFCKAGNCRINVRELPLKNTIIPQERYELKKCSVSSMRLDCVIAALCLCSRTEVQRMLLQGFVKVNHVETRKPDVQFSENDVLSVRHYGRFVIEEWCGISKKNKVCLLIRQYQ